MSQNHASCPNYGQFHELVTKIVVIMLLICLRIFIVRQQNKFFVIREQKGDEQLFVKFSNFGSKLLDFSKITIIFFKNIFSKPEKFYEVQQNVNQSHKIGKICNKLEP